MRTQQKRRRSPWLLISVVTAALALSLALVAQAKVSATPGSRLPKDKQALWDRQEKERKDAQAAPSPPKPKRR